MYLALVLAGAALLSLPQAASPELRHEEGDYFYKRLLNCTFTSASALTLTGLTIYDTDRDFSRFGQVVILALVQAGGLAALVIGGLFALGPRRRVPVKRWIVLVAAVTLSAQAAGFLLWPSESTGRGFAGVFHAVSAFCNAGFTLSHDSVVGLRDRSGLYWASLPLMIAGSLGVVVLLELLGGRRLGSRPLRWTLATMGVLVVAPAALLFLLESRDWRRPEQRLPPEVAAFMPPVMSEMPAGERAWASVYQSVSARSTGFHTVAIHADSLSPAGAGALCGLMFIGGAPGSAAGGVSVLAPAIFVAALCGRRRALRAAVSVTVIMLSTAVLTGAALYFTERGARGLEVGFEAVSAVGNSGLSMGLTPRLSIAGRVVVILAMLAGRIVAVTLAASLWSKAETDS